MSLIKLGLNSLLELKIFKIQKTRLEVSLEVLSKAKNGLKPRPKVPFEIRTKTIEPMTNTQYFG